MMTFWDAINDVHEYFVNNFQKDVNDENEFKDKKCYFHFPSVNQNK